MQLQPDYQMHSIKVDAVPLADRIASISRQLSMDGAHSFYELLDKAQGKIGVVVSFVAVLELMKRQLIGVVNSNVDSHLNNNSLDDTSTITHDTLGQLTLEWLA